MKKRIAIFCDGTWNRLEANRTTDVVHMAQAVLPTAPDKVKQVAIYVPGVGIGQGITKLSRLADRVFGGAFGWGLDERVKEAYRHLMFNYEPGDEIHIFGFSRGAYTARSLAGLIRSVGIMPRAHSHRINEAMEVYRARGADGYPDSDLSLRTRLNLSPDTATSDVDREWRAGQGVVSEQVQLAYLGVWDTVGAMGLPAFMGLWARLVNERYAFHDNVLSRSVRAARHAVAIDERRKHFPPSLWGNLDGPEGLNGAKTGPDRPYQQLWFPGTHSIVGGSGGVPALSAFPTMWIAQGAEECGLRLSPDWWEGLRSRANHMADDRGAPQRPALVNLWGLLLTDRDLRSARDADGHPTGPYDVAVVAPMVRDRVQDTDYSPKTLRPVLAELVAADGVIPAQPKILEKA